MRIGLIASPFISSRRPTTVAQNSSSPTLRRDWNEEVLKRWFTATGNPPSTQKGDRAIHSQNGLFSRKPRAC